MLDNPQATTRKVTHISSNYYSYRGVDIEINELDAVNLDRLRM